MDKKKDFLNYIKQPIFKEALKMCDREYQLEFGKYIKDTLDGFQKRPKEQ